MADYDKLPISASVAWPFSPTSSADERLDKLNAQLVMFCPPPNVVTDVHYDAGAARADAKCAIIRPLIVNRNDCLQPPSTDGALPRQK